MKTYQTKSSSLSGTNFKEVHMKALRIYRPIKMSTKRRPYVRSAYFKKDKVFLQLFWNHLFEKSNWRDRMRRLKYFPCAIDLIKYSKFEPSVKENPNRKSEILYRFAGITKEKDLFFVQIKEDKRSGGKWFVSVFPIDK